MLVLSAGCSSGQAKPTSTDNGKTVRVNAGGQIVVELDFNPSTVFTWEAKDLNVSMLQQAGETAFTSSNSGLVGASGTLTLTFKTLKAGKTNLELVYHRPWETYVKPLRTFMVTLTVK